MDVSAASFRDHTLESVTIVYSFETQSHVVEVTVRDSNGVRGRFRIFGVTEVRISEDFRHIQQLEFCIFISAPNHIYISFDPYIEGTESERDNFCFVGEGINVIN